MTFDPSHACLKIVESAQVPRACVILRGSYSCLRYQFNGLHDLGAISSFLKRQPRQWHNLLLATQKSYWNLCLPLFRMWNERMNYAYRKKGKMWVADMLTSIQKFWATQVAYRMRWCIRQHCSGDFHYMNWLDQLQNIPCWSVSAMLLASLWINQVQEVRFPV